MDHIALNWAGSDDRHFNDDVVKTFRPQPRQSGHLRPALNLKDADGVGSLHHFKSFGIIFGDVSQIERPSSFTAEFKRILHDRHHAESKEVDLHDAEIFAIILVPLRHDAAGHGRVFQRDKGDEGRHPRMGFW